MGYGPIETVIYNIDKGLTALGTGPSLPAPDPSSPARSTGPFRGASVTTSAKTRGRRASVDRHLANPGQGQARDIDVVHMHEWFEYVWDGRFDLACRS
jgi:hypothetical protein